MKEDSEDQGGDEYDVNDTAAAGIVDIESLLSFVDPEGVAGRAGWICWYRIADSGRRRVKIVGTAVATRNLSEDKTFQRLVDPKNACAGELTLRSARCTALPLCSPA